MTKPIDLSQRPAQDNQQSWLADPNNRAMLMQAGIAMMQPMQWGQSPVAHMASSLGQGFEARDRGQAAELAAQKTQAEADRAAASAARAEEGIGIQREKLELSKAREGRLAGGKKGISALFKSPAHREQEVLKRLAALAKQEAETSILSGEMKSQAELLSNPDWVAKNRPIADSMVVSDQSSAPAASPAPAAGAQQYPEGHIQRNPKTGQRRQMRNGQWVILPATGG
jgi:hypothetical protein